jgi:hypothetical protein
VISKEYGLGAKNIEARLSLDVCIENGPSAEEEEIVVTQPTYGGVEGLGWAEGDEGCCDGIGDDHGNMEANGDDNHASDDDDESWRW